MNYWKFFAIAYFCSFYDGHLVQRVWCSVTKCSTNSRGKEKGPAFKLPQNDPLRSQGIGFVGQECWLIKRYSSLKTFRGKIFKQKRKENQIKSSFKSCSYYCQFKEVLNPKAKTSKDELSKFKERKSQNSVK